MLDFQPQRTLAWLRKVFFGNNLDLEERVLRFSEEVIELGQAEGITREQHHALVDQVHDKPIGDPEQEVGGVLVTFGSYAAVKGINPSLLYEREFTRCEDPEIIKRIRIKHRNKLVVSSKTRSE